MKILLDMDGVIAEFLPRLIEMYNHLTNEGIKITDIRSNNSYKWFGDQWLAKKIKDSTGFIRSLKPAEGAIEAVEDLHRRGHEIVFVSNGTNCPSSGHEKREWLKYYFHKTWKFAPLVLTYHKHHVRGDCLVDDTPRNLDNLHPTTQGLLWHQPYNAEVTGYERIYDWSHLLDWITKNDQIV